MHDITRSKEKSKSWPEPKNWETRQRKQLHYSSSFAPFLSLFCSSYVCCSIPKKIEEKDRPKTTSTIIIKHHQDHSYHFFVVVCCPVLLLSLSLSLSGWCTLVQCALNYKCIIQILDFRSLLLCAACWRSRT